MCARTHARSKCVKSERIFERAIFPLGTGEGVTKGGEDVEEIKLKGERGGKKER